MTRSRLPHAIIWSVCLVGAGLGADWPTYMRDATRVGYTPESLPASLSQQWVYTSPAPPKRAWPGPAGEIVEGLKLQHRVRFDDVLHVALVGDAAYFGSSVDNTVYCVHTRTGAVRWSFVTAGPVRLAPTVVNGRVHVGSDDGFAYCLDADNGNLIWKLRAGPGDERILARGRMTSRWPIRTGILVDNGYAYLGAGVFPHDNIFLYAVRAETGEIVWKNDTISQREAGRDDLTPQGYLLASDETLFVPSGRTLPAAFDRKTGRRLHKQGGGGKQVGGAKALLADGQLYSIGGEEYILALNQGSGSIENRLLGRQMTLHGPMAYIADGSHVMAIDRERFAASKTRRLELESQLADVQRQLRRNPAAVQLERVRQLQQELAEGQKAAHQPGTPHPQEAAELAARDAIYKEKTQALTAAMALYDVSRKQHQSLSKQLDELRTQIDVATGDGVQWRRELPHESALALTGNAVVAGGIGEVVLLDAETGEPIWRHKVDGEARGLAVANGFLLVSTTTGKIYCFGDSTSPTDQAGGEADIEPYSPDELSAMYATAADQIVRQSGVTRGFCLVYGNQQGRLAYELAKKTDLVVYCLEADEEKVAAARRALAPTGFYGTRITVDHCDLSVDPYPNYFANLIVSDTLLVTGQMPGEPTEVSRHLKPEGGVMCLAQPRASGADAAGTGDPVQRWVTRTKLVDEKAQVEKHGGWTVVKRGALPGVAYWSHQYGNAGNTSSVDDQRVRSGVGVLWYGDPGPSSMVNRHQGAVGPVSVAGRMFLQGDETVMAYDAYNGLLLWERENPGAIRTGVYNNFEPGNLVATEDSLFMVLGDHCQRLDSATGEVQRTYVLPASNEKTGQWGYVGCVDGRLYGTSTNRKMVAEEARRRGRPTEADASDQIFAIDADTGQLQWTHKGQNISHTTVALDGQRVYFIDSSITSEERDRMVRQDKTDLERLTGKARELAEERLKRIDVRRAVALDAATGQLQWSELVDVTDCTGVGIGAGRLTLMAKDNYVVLCGANANGHYWKQFLAGDFQRRRLVVLSADDGHKIWVRDANYRHRPIVVEDRIIAEPWAYYLPTGEQEVRIHPLTGQQTPWKFIRPGHHCGALTATPGMLFFRSGFTAYYDLEKDSGTRHFGGHRLGCWINFIPANGLVIIPEASAGCACLFSLTATVVFEPQENRQVWSVYTAEGPTTPVQHMALNLGAPGDRRDAHGKLWLSYPRPASRQGLDLPLDIRPLAVFGTTGRYFQQNSDSVDIEGTDTPWLFTSGTVGLTHCELPLIGDGQEPAKYTVRLYLTAPEGDVPGQRVFDIRLQGRTVSEKMDVVAESGGVTRALTVEYDGILVSRELAVDLIPRGNRLTDSHLPVLSAIEVVRAGDGEIVQDVAAR